MARWTRWAMYSLASHHTIPSLRHTIPHLPSILLRCRHHLMLTCACMISVRLSDLLTQAKLSVPFLFAMDILEPLVYICWSPIDVPPAELWEGQSYLNCSRGDLVQFITKDDPLPRPRHRCVYALNLRTMHRGWLFQYRDGQLKVVGCLSDILTLVSQGLPLLQDAAPSSVPSCVCEGCISPETERPLVAEAEAEPSVHEVQCGHCDNNWVTSCYSGAEDSWEATEMINFCYKAQGWDKNKSGWRCPIHHWKTQDCQDWELYPVCQNRGHGVFQHAEQLPGQHHIIIQEELDAAVERMIKLGYTYSWSHPDVKGYYPSTSPSVWAFTSAGSRVWSIFA